MIKLEKMSIKFPELDLIAEWRNQTMITLRSSDLTAKGESQANWVRSFGPKEKYYFIYNGNPSEIRLGGKKSECIGYCGLDKINSVNKTAEMGLLINPNQHKNGYGTAAVKELLRMAFMDFNLNNIFIEVINTTDNYLFWEKQGFFIEGVFRERHFKNGSYWGAKIYSILKHDWKIKQRDENISKRLS